VDKRPVLAIDLEGTLADIEPRVREVLKNTFNINAESVSGFGFDYDVISTILSSNEEAALFKKIWELPNKINLMDRNIPVVLNNLSKLYILRIRTATMGDHSVIIAWLKENRVKYDEIEFVNGHTDKVRDGIDVYVDDHPELVKRIAQSGKKVVLIKHSYNTYIEKELPKYDGHIFIASDWNEAYKILQKISSGIVAR